MCDTILASPDSTAEQVMLFGKNSDRNRNEAQVVEYFAPADHAPGAQLRCTYLTIPQVAHTHAVLLSRPFWMWGAEMGANEYGVVIGNEALQARSASPQEEALIGMDLLRLALERAITAEEAVNAVTALLEQFGQGGNCGHLRPAYYNNGFIIADASEAFVLETLGREWLVERIRGVRSISNVYSIGRHPHRISGGLSKLIQDLRWSDEPAPNYADVIANPQNQHIGQSRARWARSTSLLQSSAQRLGAAEMMRILRDHATDEASAADWHPRQEKQRTLCMHAASESFGAQSTGSLVSEIHPGDSVHWVTGTAAPCMSIFKPVLMDVPLPAHGSRPTDRYDVDSLWWRHERLHRTVILGDFAMFLADIRAERDALEADFQARIAAVLNGGSAAERARVVAECWKEAAAMEDRWFALRRTRGVAEDETPYRSAWSHMSRLAGFNS